MSDPFVRIAVAAAELKRSALPQFDEFLKSVQVLKEHYRTTLVAAGGDGVLIAQGKAQALDQLVTKLENCQQLEIQYRGR